MDALCYCIHAYTNAEPIYSYLVLNFVVRFPQPVNDLAPVFSSTTYTATVAENLAVGTAIGITVSATDPEPGHTVTYFSVSSDTQSAFFHVDQTSGSITLAHSLDADPPTSHSSFSFRVC